MAQELREKLKLNVASSKKKSFKKDSVERVYSSNLMLINDHKKVSENNVSTHKVNVAKNSDATKTAQVKIDKATCNFTTRKFTSPKSINGAKQNDAINKKIQDTRSKTSPKIIETKSKKGKNFILENKLNVKKISSANKLQAERNFNDDSQNVCNIVYTYMKK